MLVGLGVVLLRISKSTWSSRPSIFRACLCSCVCMMTKIEALVAQVGLGEGAMVAVVVGIIARFYFGDTVFHPRYAKIWGAIRSFGVPILNKIVKSRFGLSIENQAFSSEFVAAVEADSVTEITKKLNEVRNFEVPLLAGYKTDWKNNEEIATLVCYHGSRPWPGAPHWLRNRQLHLTFFKHDNGKIVVTAHEEANSYRPDLWKNHLLGESQDRLKGVKMAEAIMKEADIL